MTDSGAYVVNARDVLWRQREGLGRWADLEGDRNFDELGFQLVVVQPGEPVCMYHGESEQEDCLVVAGECTLVIEGEERRLKQCGLRALPTVDRITISLAQATDRARSSWWAPREPEGGEGIICPVDDIAAKHGASVETETPEPARGLRVPSRAAIRRRIATADLPELALMVPEDPAGADGERPRPRGRRLVRGQCARGAVVRSEELGPATTFEGEPVLQLGFHIEVLYPGQPNCMYHGESEQEDFLVVSGECIAIIEGEERRLKAWDFVHCPADDRARLRRRGRWPMRHRDGRRAQVGRIDPLSRQRGGGEARRECAGGDAESATTRTHASHGPNVRRSTTATCRDRRGGDREAA